MEEAAENVPAAGVSAQEMSRAGTYGKLTAQPIRKHRLRRVRSNGGTQQRERADSEGEEDSDQE